jgi:hypothetical protein
MSGSFRSADSELGEPTSNAQFIKSISPEMVRAAVNCEEYKGYKLYPYLRLIRDYLEKRGVLTRIRDELQNRQ